MVGEIDTKKPGFLTRLFKRTPDPAVAESIAKARGEAQKATDERVAALKEHNSKFTSAQDAAKNWKKPALTPAVPSKGTSKGAKVSR